MINGDDAMEAAVAQRRTQIGGDWFFWIAGLSLASTLLKIMNVPIGFFFRLGITTIASPAAYGVGTSLAVTVLAAAFFAFYGFFARNGQQWAFITGGLFYLLDVLLLVVSHQYLEIVAHAYVLFRIFQGFQGAQRLQAIRARQEAEGRRPGETPGVWPPPPSV